MRNKTVRRKKLPWLMTFLLILGLVFIIPIFAAADAGQDPEEPRTGEQEPIEQESGEQEPGHTDATGDTGEPGDPPVTEEQAEEEEAEEEAQVEEEQPVSGIVQAAPLAQVQSLIEADDAAVLPGAMPWQVAAGVLTMEAEGTYIMVFLPPENAGLAEFDYDLNAYYPQINPDFDWAKADEDEDYSGLWKTIVPNFEVRDQDGNVVSAYPGGENEWAWSGDLSAQVVGDYSVTAAKDGVEVMGNWKIAQVGIAPMMWEDPDLEDIKLIQELIATIAKVSSYSVRSTDGGLPSLPRFGQYLRSTTTQKITFQPYTTPSLNVEFRGLADSQRYILPNQLDGKYPLSLSGAKFITRVSVSDESEYDLTTALPGYKLIYANEQQATILVSFPYAPQPIYITYADKSIVYGQAIPSRTTDFYEGESYKTKDIPMPSGYAAADASTLSFSSTLAAGLEDPASLGAAKYSDVLELTLNGTVGDNYDMDKEYWYSIENEKGGTLTVERCPTTNTWSGNNGKSRVYDPSVTTTETINLYATAIELTNAAGGLPYNQTNTDTKAKVTFTFVDKDNVTEILYNGVLSDSQSFNMTAVGTYTISIAIEDSTSNYTYSGTSFKYTIEPPKTYTVSYLPNGGSGSYADTNLAVGSYTVKTLAVTGISRAGYSFNGWNTKAGGGGTSYAPGGAITITGDLTLYAQWTANSTDGGKDPDPPKTVDPPKTEDPPKPDDPPEPDDPPQPVNPPVLPPAITGDGESEVRERDGGGYTVTDREGTVTHLLPDDSGMLVIDDNGTPLGHWAQDDAGVWIYEPYVPLGNLPQTGAAGLYAGLLAIFLAAVAALFVTLKSKKRGSES